MSETYREALSRYPQANAANENPFSSPSAYLQAPSSSQEAVEHAKPTQSQLTGSIEEDGSVPDGNGDVSDDERENRFMGPARTWQRYTEDERALVASLDQQRANDLSVHLYNAHTLKFRHYDRDLAAKAKPWQIKQSWMHSEHGGNLSWHPDQNWTAWPLPPAEVPRKDEAFGKPFSDDGFDGETWQKPTPWKPSRDLEYEVNAIMLRNAKEQFRRRTWAASDAHKSSQSDVPRSRSISRSRSCRQSNATSNQADGVSSEGFAMEDSGVVEPTENTEPPVLMADDEEASRLLKPSMRHVLSKLDDLLMALHHSGHGHHASSVAQPDSGANPTTQKRKRRSTTDDAAVTAASMRNAGRKRVQRVKTADRDYAKHTSRPHAIRTRDWSEVLGVASLAGWDPAVVERAAKRCASLFGENMSFRTMPETSVDAAADSLVEYHPEIVHDIDLVSDKDSADDKTDDGYGFPCPEQSCSRWREPYEHRWRLHEHLRKRHGYSREDVEDFARADETTTPVADSRITLEQPVGDDCDEDDPFPDAGGAIHVDGFMQPVHIKLYRGKDAKPRSRRSSRAPGGALGKGSRRSSSGELDQMPDA